MSIFRSIATLLSGSVIGQLLSLAAYPVVTRLFSPDDFGLFNIFYSYIEVLMILSTGKYELALPIAASDAEARAVLAFARRLNALVSLLLLAVITLLLVLGLMPAQHSQLGYVALLIPPVVFFGGNVRLHSFLFNRYERYRVIALSTATYGGATALLKILAGFLSALLPLLSRVGLPLATVLGQAAADLPYLVARRSERSEACDRPSAAARRDAARRHSHFPRYVMPKDLLNSFAFNLPFLWLAHYFADATVGLFALALTVCFRPVTLVAADVERVLYATVAQMLQQRRPMGSLIGRFMLRIVVLAVPAFVVLFVFAEPLLAFVFGSEWGAAAVYVRWLAPWCLLSFVTSVLSFVPNVFSTQRIEFLLHVLLAVLWVGAMLAGIVGHSFLLAIQLYALAGIVVAVATLLWYVGQIRRYDRANSA